MGVLGLRQGTEGQSCAMPCAKARDLRCHAACQARSCCAVPYAVPCCVPSQELLCHAVPRWRRYAAEQLTWLILQSTMDGGSKQVSAQDLQDKLNECDRAGEKNRMGVGMKEWRRSAWHVGSGSPQGRGTRQHTGLQGWLGGWLGAGKGAALPASLPPAGYGHRPRAA